ncbi:hypothetical protein AVEN_203722-1 [Araneus ventricosus]|uniref:Uncharacterized protein n=1 Tax=Araneus ventricosus TaxID=182803 RepID=A0A4Y2ISK0_ARAVE|nr:hypothetical protein AVEN_203722-1 [Araneus ventricosus]
MSLVSSEPLSPQKQHPPPPKITDACFTRKKCALLIDSDFTGVSPTRRDGKKGKRASTPSVYPRRLSQPVSRFECHLQGPGHLAGASRNTESDSAVASPETCRLSR